MFANPSRGVTATRRLVVGLLFSLLIALAVAVEGGEAAADENVRDVQQILNSLGYDAGPLDGAWGRRTGTALAAYAAKEGVAFEGQLSNEIHAAMVEAHRGFLTGRRHLDAALRLPSLEMFPLENEQCVMLGTNLSTTPVYYRTVDRDVHGSDRIQGFVDAVGFAVGAHLGHASRRSPAHKSGRSDRSLRALASHLEAAARDEAFTELSFGGRGPNPAHWVSALLHNVALFVHYADRRDLWQPGQRDLIVAWGNRLYDTSHRVAGPGRGRIDRSGLWHDTAGLQAMSYVTWGIATSNVDALSEGVEEWFKLHRLIQSDGGMKTFLNGGRWQDAGGRENNDFYYDNVLGFMVVAATALQSVGVDVFSQPSNGATLHDAVRWKILFSTDWQQLAGVTREPVYDNHNGRRRYWQHSSAGGNWGWTEAYLHAFPAAEIAARIRARNNEVVGMRSYGSTTMGPMSCLFGVHR